MIVENDLKFKKFENMSFNKNDAKNVAKNRHNVDNNNNQLLNF